MNTHAVEHAHKAHRYTRLHSCRLVLQTHTHLHTCTHSRTHKHGNCQATCLEREDPCHLLFHPASPFWLPNCQSPLSTTSHAEKQMSACHFSRHLTLKCSSSSSISEGGETKQKRETLTYVSLWHSSPALALTAPCTFR